MEDIILWIKEDLYKAISIDKKYDEDKAFEIYSKVRRQPNKKKNKERVR